MKAWPFMCCCYREKQLQEYLKRTVWQPCVEMTRRCLHPARAATPRQLYHWAAIVHLYSFSLLHGFTLLMYTNILLTSQRYGQSFFSFHAKACSKSHGGVSVHSTEFLVLLSTLLLEKKKGRCSITQLIPPSVADFTFVYCTWTRTIMNKLSRRYQSNVLMMFLTFYTLLRKVYATVIRP